MTKGETDFINEYTRQLLVDWAHRCLTRTNLTGTVATSEPGLALNPEYIYNAHAISKGWISKDGHRVLAKGYEVAAAYLRR